METIKREKLFWASCIAMLVTSLSFGIRAGIMNRLVADFNLPTTELGVITASAFWGFPPAIIVGGFIVDLIGVKKLLVMAFVMHLAGILLTVFASGYRMLFLSTLLIGIGNGTVEAACNPLFASLYTDNKTTKLNHFHFWFPGGIVIGTLLVLLLSAVNIGWQLQVALMIIQTLAYSYLFSMLKFLVTEQEPADLSHPGEYHDRQPGIETKPRLLIRTHIPFIYVKTA
ncbi:MAG: MFS transporter [Mucilaginibacter polytrichastri]|nr:MFS transporter [Mucilaginibacter polytrichastri]